MEGSSYTWQYVPCGYNKCGSERSFVRNVAAKELFKMIVLFISQLLGEWDGLAHKSVNCDCSECN